MGMCLADNVRRMRRQLGMSQAELIKRTGATSIKLIETQRVSSPRFPTLQAIAEVFGVTVADLFSEHDQKKRAARRRRRRRTSRGS